LQVDDARSITMTFAGKDVLITGGSSGIGKAAAIQLAAAGANLFVIARDPGRLAGAVDEMKARASQPAQQIIRAFSADVARYEQVCAVVKELADAGHVPDYLFNIAGFARPGCFPELPLRVFREEMDINFFGMVHTCKAVAPFMMQRGSGHIVNTSSGAGIVGVFGYSAYCASKFAVRGFTDVLRSELKPYGIKVSALFPPNTDTPGLATENLTKPPETHALEGGVATLSPERVAREMLRGVERGQVYIIPGFDSKLTYALSGLLGTKFNLILDMIIRGAQKKSGGPAACPDPNVILSEDV